METHEETMEETLIARKVEEICRWSDGKYAGLNLEKNIQVSFYDSGVKAGLAYSHIFRVEFNRKLLENNLEEFLEQVSWHEVAHIIANRFYKQDCGHGILWQAVMISMGKSPERCHQMDISETSNHRFMWKCQKCGARYFVGKNLHNKMLKNPRICHHCKSTIFYTKNQELNADF